MLNSNSNLKIDRTKICPKCKYDANPRDAIKCPLCQTKLTNKAEVCHTDKLDRKKVSRSSLSKIKGTNKASQIELALKNQTKNWLNFVRQSPKKRLAIAPELNEIKKPLNLVGLILVGLGIALWGNYFLTSTRVEVIEVPVTKDKTQDAPAKPPVPTGLFNYGGDPIFSALVSSGINLGIGVAYPGFELRYAKPLNNDFSSLNGIKMLLGGELSFAYNARSINSSEYKEANLRSIKLKSVPIAIDGVAIYSNVKAPKSKLNRSQIRQIFSGELTNWNQINPNFGDLPIVPVIVEDENLNLLELSTKSEVANSARYVGNYTQAIRETIRTPGAISFASYSLVKDQQLVKKFALADGSSSDYVKPSVRNFRDGEYPLTRRIYLVYRLDGTVDQKAAEAYIDFIGSFEGKEIVTRAGLVPIF